MIATFRNHKWNKEPYLFHGETYHTAFSDFTVTYNIPKSYTLASTSENDRFPSQNRGSFSVNRVKEIFITLLKKPRFATAEQDGTSIRVFGSNKKVSHEVLQEAEKSFSFYQKK
ncbi:hypothetical protein [Sporolactobacillus spathodeae]|uniref:Uncharacterized protein n=1 Tax=Sporolactobacillus spathodeae TaxID=1465502 RepID=A0ABS2QB82_9BACL|nr:hypothetical protein [Sporolactobacillus spathodeae]MBM7658665.1 hypothetical protein [Sporolactobacillus spathodeae]